jgi:hypothetical protein
MSAHYHAGVAVIAAVLFVANVVHRRGHPLRARGDAFAGPEGSRHDCHLLDGFRAVQGNKVLGWTIFGTVRPGHHPRPAERDDRRRRDRAADMGQSGTGPADCCARDRWVLGIFFAMSTSRPERLIRTEIVALIFWGLPLAVIGITSLARSRSPRC